MYDPDIAGIMRDVIQPQLEVSHFIKPYRDLVAQFSEANWNPGGDTIQHQIQTSVTSNAENYTVADVDSQAGSYDTVTAYWDLAYQQTAVEVSNIRINQAKNGGVKGITDLLSHATKNEMDGLWSLIYDNVYAQIKADLLASGTYSDAGLSRVTYPTLLPYNEVNDTQITVGLVNAMQFQTTLNKNAPGRNGYRMIMEPTVLYAFEPQAAAINQWNAENKNDQPVAMGHAPIASFRGTPVSSVQAMTVGDVFYVQPTDVKLVNHYPLTIKEVPSGRDSRKFMIRTGVNAYVTNVGKQAMMTDKD